MRLSAFTVLVSFALLGALLLRAGDESAAFEKAAWTELRSSSECRSTVTHFDDTGAMEESKVIDLFSALAHATRMATFRHLVARAPDGVAAGVLAKSVGVPQSTLSAHLTVLASVGLVSSARRSRSIVYRAELDVLRDALIFLLTDCCGGKPAICQPLIVALDRCCHPSAQQSDL